MSNQNRPASIDRRGFLKLMAAGAAATPLALAGCGSSQQTADAPATTEAATDVAGAKLTFVGDDAFAPYRYLEVQDDGSQKVAGLDIAIADEMASRLGFTYDFEPQEFAATLASVQSSGTSFTMAMSANEEREQTYDFTRGYYQPLVGVLTMSDEVKKLEDLKGKSIACTTGTVQNKFIAAVMPDADIHTYDGGDQCLQEVLAGRVDAYLCDGAEGQSMRDANEGLVLGLLDRSETKDYVGVYRVMATKGASFVGAFDACIAEMLEDGTIDGYISQYVGEDFAWNGDTSASGQPTTGVVTSAK
ncbi:transporter substrate-binding domain-containing protein [uncultured Parolsenella sp.]|uniref:substrate-binding periplasmic protein n=1 Tax=uncultured Parolsenella sp. TaxID=2083008 RepID=UPI0025E9486D|nr:transporter substrate-binding domain-containing protein [uncultured Parolsenella sp.]